MTVPASQIQRRHNTPAAGLHPVATGRELRQCQLDVSLETWYATPQASCCLKLRKSRRKLHNRCKGPPKPCKEKSNTIRESTQPWQDCCWFPQCGRYPRLFQPANRFGATFGLAFSLKRSSGWALRSRFWMGQGKLGRGTLDNTRKRHHTPPHTSELAPNKQLGLGFCNTYVDIRTWYVQRKKKTRSFLSVFYLISGYLTGLGASKI